MGDQYFDSEPWNIGQPPRQEMTTAELLDLIRSGIMTTASEPFHFANRLAAAGRPSAMEPDEIGQAAIVHGLGMMGGATAFGRAPASALVANALPRNRLLGALNSLSGPAAIPGMAAAGAVAGAVNPDSTWQEGAVVGGLGGVAANAARYAGRGVSSVANSLANRARASLPDDVIGQSIVHGRDGFDVPQSIPSRPQIPPPGLEDFEPYTMARRNPNVRAQIGYKGFPKKELELLIREAEAESILNGAVSRNLLGRLEAWGVDTSRFNAQIGTRTGQQTGPTMQDVVSGLHGERQRAAAANRMADDIASQHGNVSRDLSSHIRRLEMERGAGDINPLDDVPMRQAPRVYRQKGD